MAKKKEEGDKSQAEILKGLREKYLAETSELVGKTKEYKEFEKGAGRVGLWYEQACQFVRGLGFELSMSEKDKAELKQQISLLDLDIRPEDVLMLSMISLLLLALVGLLLFIPLGLPGLAVSFLGLVAFMYLRNYPSRLIKIRQAKAGSELILAILYMVIFMRTTSNLELAVKFVADNLETSLSDDFRKMIWDVSSRKYASIKEALDDYVDKWKGYSRIFADAIHLIEASLYQGGEDTRVTMLNKALDLTLEGTFETMTRYANALRMPINLLYMMGIMLPVLGLVMFPIMGAFLSDIVNPAVLIILYDVILPLGVYLFAQYSLANRPAGFPIPDISKHPEVPPPGTFSLQYGEEKIYIKAWIPAALALALIILPGVIYVAFFTTPSPAETDIYVTLFLPIGPAVGLYLYAALLTKDRMKIRKQIGNVESEFAEAAFQLGNRLSEGYPLEIALSKVSNVLGDTDTAKLFQRISKNITELGMDVERAVFDREMGAIYYYPSAIVRSVMRIAVMSAKKSMEVAAVSLINMSNYLRDVHRIDEKVKDILSETLSSMKFQASFLAPVISGLVVGLTGMILIILDILGQQVAEMVTGETAGLGLGAGTWILGIFQVSEAIPLYVFQPVVGFYVVEIIFLLTIIDSQIELGGDKLFSMQLLKKILPVGLIIYVLTTFAVTVLFTGIARVAVTAGTAFGG